MISKYYFFKFILKNTNFNEGDLLSVIEQYKDRTYKGKGICIHRDNKGIYSKFVIKNYSHGMIFKKSLLINSPSLLKITILKKNFLKKSILRLYQK